MDLVEVNLGVSLTGFMVGLNMAVFNLFLDEWDRGWLCILTKYEAYPSNPIYHFSTFKKIDKLLVIASSFEGLTLDAV